MNLKDFENQLADIREKETAAVFSSEGTLLDWFPREPNKEKLLKETLIPMVLSLMKTASGTGLPHLSKILIEGSKKKLFFYRISSDKTWIVLQGTPALNIGLAIIKLKQLASSEEEITSGGDST